MTRTTKLSCGGKGPCCHVGYSHRHCAHCDTVVSLVLWPYVDHYQPYRTYYPWWGNTGAGTQIGTGTNLYAMNSTAAGAAIPTVPALAEHACEVIP